jgi:hypothetical protein
VSAEGRLDVKSLSGAASSTWKSSAPCPRESLRPVEDTERFVARSRQRAQGAPAVSSPNAMAQLSHSRFSVFQCRRGGISDIN